MKRSQIRLIMVWIFMAWMTGYAQNNSAQKDSVKYELSHVVVTANRYERNIFETHLPANVIRQKQIWQKGFESLGELIEEAPGVNYTQVGPWSQKMVIRGLVGPHILTLVDGMRLGALRSYGNHAPLLDVNQLERVEIIRGPASLLYGSEAIAGVVNYITLQPRFSDAGFILQGDVRTQYSSVNQQHTERIHLAGGNNRTAFLLGLSYRKANDIDTPGGKLKNTEFEGYTLDTKVNYKLSSSHLIGLNLQSDHLNDVGVPINKFAKWAKFIKYNRDLLSVKYEYSAPSNLLTNAKLNFYYQKGERNFDTFLSQIPKGPVFANQYLTAHRLVDSYGGSFQNSLSFRKNLFISGVDVFADYDNTERQADAFITNAAGAIVKDPPPDNTPPTPKSDRSGVGIFIEDEYAASERWNFSLGTRFDYIVSNAQATTGTLINQDTREIDRDFSGNIGVLFRLTKNIHLIANVGRAFKAPTLQERYFKGVAQVGYLLGNPNLKSETSLNVDGGVKWKSSHMTGELNLFRNIIDNFIVMKPISVRADTFLYDNVGKAELYGGEFAIRIKPNRNFTLFMNNAYVYGQDINLDEPLPKIPPLKTLIGLRYEPESGSYWVEIESRIVDTQNRVADNEPETPGYTLFNFGSGVNLQSMLRLPYPLVLTVNVKNILNRRYRDHLSYVTWWDAPGRNVIVGLRSNF